MEHIDFNANPLQSIFNDAMRKIPSTILFTSHLKTNRGYLSLKDRSLHDRMHHASKHTNKLCDLDQSKLASSIQLYESKNEYSSGHIHLAVSIIYIINCSLLNRKVPLLWKICLRSSIFTLPLCLNIEYIGWFAITVPDFNDFKDVSCCIGLVNNWCNDNRMKLNI